MNASAIGFYIPKLAEGNVRQKPTKKILFFTILLLLSSVSIWVFATTHIDPDIYIPPNFLSSTTPTPYSLPTQVYGSPSFFTTVLGQIFRKTNQSIDSTRIIQNGQHITENPYINLYEVDNYRPVGIEWWQQESKLVYEYVRDRFDTTLNDKVIVIFFPPKSGNCAPRGTTLHESQSIIVIFASQDTSKEQILATLAHELGHVFIHKKYENLSDLALNEGLATWAAGDYWKAWKGFDFDSGVNDFINHGTYLPLFSNFDMKPAYDDSSSSCITNRDILLTEIASFIDFLSQNYGVEKLANLFKMKRPEVINNQRIAYPPNFKEVYGVELNQLEYVWLKSLSQHGDCSLAK